MAINWDGAKAELWTLIKSFLGAIVAAASLAALNWIGAHIPMLLQGASTVAAAYGAQKFHS